MGEGIVIRIKMFLVQIPLDTWLGLGIQPRYEAPIDLWVKNVKVQ